MRFGEIAVADAEGAVLAHAVSAGEARLRKSTVLTRAHLDALAAAGVATVIAAQLDPGDVGEDEAATRVARALNPAGLEAKPASTGRVNIHATAAGVFTVDRAIIDAINRHDPAITVATLADFAAVEAGRMVATVKIIPYAVAGARLDEVVGLCAGSTVLQFQPFQARDVGLIQTMVHATKASVLDKTVRVTAVRLARSGSRIAEERRVAHARNELALAIGDLAGRFGLVIAFGASATSDPDDVVPAAIRQAGGVVHRVGMPVDPGNLIVWGEVGGTPVLGAPGCARSPKENGFDWVLDRLLSGAGVTPDAIAGMGVGGLLMEIATRPQPREATASKVTHSGVHAIVLAAGRSSRMGGPNKLLAAFDGTPLVRRTVERVLASQAAGVTLVSGHQRERVEMALQGLDIAIVHNPDFAEGLATSLRVGIAAAPASAEGCLIVLADMPAVSSQDLNRLIQVFTDAGGEAAVRAAHAGKRGNPVLLPRAVFSSVATLEGDTGARHLLESGDVDVIDIEIGQGASVDVDTPEALALAGGVLQD